MDLHISTDVVADRVVLSLTGIADLSTAPRFHDRLRRTVVDHPGRSVVVDLDGLILLDDAVLGLLLGAAARARSAGGDLVVVCTRSTVRERLATTRFDQIVDVLDGIV